MCLSVMSHLLSLYCCYFCHHRHHHYHGVILNTVFYSHQSQLCLLLHFAVSDTLSSVFAALLLRLHNRDVYLNYAAKKCFWFVQFSCLGHAVAQWLRHCATHQNVAGLIPNGVIGSFH
jgi:hypothetical protein